VETSAVEVGRTLEITQDGQKYVIPPVPARIGAGLHASLMGITFGTFTLTEDEQINMFQTAMGEELFEMCQNTLRLDEMTPISTIALYWNTVGIEAVEAYLAGGVKKALEVILSRNGLLPQTSPSLAPAVTTNAPAFMRSTDTPSGGVTKSAAAPA
jgi:hypothetical protein